MAIYIGSTRLTGTTEVHLRDYVPEVYIGGFLTYPEGTIRHEFHNGSMQYVNYVTVNNNKYLRASGKQDSYAYYKADVYTYRGNTFVSSASDETLIATKVSGDSAFHINERNEIYADDRENVTGGTRSATYRFSYGGTTAATVEITQQANSMYPRQQTNGLTASTLMNQFDMVNGKYPSTGGTYYIKCDRAYEYWTGYTSGFETTHTPATSTTSAMTYFNTEYVSWLSTGTTQGGDGGYPRTLIIDENYSTGEAGNRSATTITVGYPVSGEWTDYNYVTASTVIEQWGRAYNTYAYRISSISISNDSWAGSATGTAYTETVTAESQYKTTTWRDGSTSSTGNWITYTGRPDMCGNQKPQAGLGNGYYFYLRNPANDATGMSQMDMYYPTTSTTYGTMGVFPYQVNSNPTPRTQDLIVTFGDASTAITLTQLGNIYYQLSPDSLSFPATGATSALTVSASSSGWGVSASTNWLSLSTVGNNVYVTASNNVGPATQARTGSVSIYYNGTVQDTTTVSQAADNYVFTALTTTEVSLAATATSYSNLAIQSTKAGNALPITTSNISITNNTMGLGISGDLVTGGTGIYMVPLSCNTNTSTSTTKSATLTITQPESGKQLVYHFQQGVADNTNIPGVAKLFDLENGWQVGTVTIAWGGSNSTEPVKMIVVVRKSATTNTNITMLGDYLLFPPPNHERTIVQINGGNAKTFSYTSGSTFQLTDVSDKNNPQTLTLNGVNTTFSGINATMNRSTTTPPVSGTCYITIT